MNREITVVEGSKAHLPRLIPLWTELYKTEKAGGLAYALRDDAADVWMRETDRRLESSNFYLFVALYDLDIVGFHAGQIRRRPGIYQDLWVGSVSELYVSAEHRGRGIARALVSRALVFMKGKNIKRLEVQTVPGNTTSQALWQSLGWQVDFISWRSDIED